MSLRYHQKLRNYMFCRIQEEVGVVTYPRRQDANTTKSKQEGMGKSITILTSLSFLTATFNVLVKPLPSSIVKEFWTIQPMLNTIWPLFIGTNFWNCCPRNMQF
jgi:hypothetical protein